MSETPQQPAAPVRPALALRAQYIKDLSFENPRAPQAIFALREAPQIEISINLGSGKLDENVFELGMHLNARAIAENATVFLCDLVYAGVIELQNIPEAEQEQAVFIGGANLLFPFARRVLSDITRDGGFPPLNIDPVDFAALYLNQRAQAGQA